MIYINSYLSGKASIKPVIEGGEKMPEICPACNAIRKQNAAFCEICGYRFEERHCPNCNCIIGPEAGFCKECGYKLTGINASPPLQNTFSAPPPVQVENIPAPPDPGLIYNNQMNQAKPKKSKVGWIIGIIVAALIIAAAVIFIPPMLNKSSKPAETAVVAPIKQEKKEVSAPKYSYDAPKIIRPALYQSTDYVVYFKGSSEEDKELLLTVEIPGFTQKYEQKIILKPQEMKLKVRPPLIEGVLKTLNKSKEAQIKVALMDTSTQKYLIQDSKPISILSKYDMKWASDDGKESYYENICAWVTPESPKIKELLRNSIDQLSLWSQGSINAVVGYQPIGGLQDYEVTYYQTAAIYETLRTYYGVRYNATPVSTSGKEAQQRIALPEDVINQKSGLCIETAVTMVSAIEATGMHGMVLILPGHAQVAVETWPESGDYYLVETTALTEPNWDNIIVFLDKTQWTQYLYQNQVTVIDVDLAREDGIKPME